ncbi:MAG: metallophosphoesterase family protein [Gemmatimonadaceae bacterium]
MRLIHFADLHLGFRQFHRLTPDGGNQREADVARAFTRAIDRTIELQPDVILIGGDVFHSVRPSNPAILLAFTEFSRLVRSLPRSDIVMVAGNHDTPRTQETGCILRLFTPLGIHVVEPGWRRLSFEDKNLSVLAVPDIPGERVFLEPDPAYRYNVLLLHGEIAGMVPWHRHDAEQPPNVYRLEDLAPERWSYVALGHYHVYSAIAPNACYSGALEYASPDVWGERREEKSHRIPGKGIVEFDLDKGMRQFHPLRGLRSFIDLPSLDARGMSASDVDAAIRAHVDACPGGITNTVVRQVIREIPRHIARELDHKALREYKRRALHFQLDARRPETAGQRSGLSGRRASLADIVRDKLHGRPLSSDVDRPALVELGMRYLADAAAREEGALAAQVEGE